MGIELNLGNSRTNNSSKTTLIQLVNLKWRDEALDFKVSEKGRVERGRSWGW